MGSLPANSSFEPLNQEVDKIGRLLNILESDWFTLFFFLDSALDKNFNFLIASTHLQPEGSGCKFIP